MRRALSLAAVVGVVAVGAPAASPPAAAALSNPLAAACSAAGVLSGLLGKACSLVQHGGRVLGAGRQLLSGKLPAAAKTLLGGGGGVTRAAAEAVGLAAAGAWAAHGAKAALDEAARVIGHVTEPKLTSTWFSATYWRVAGLAALLTVPFLFAAAIHALIRSEPALLARATFGYLPLALLAVSIAAPLTMLLLAASDQMSAIVAASGGHAGGRFLAELGAVVGGLSGIGHSTFLVLLVGVVIVAGALALALELLMREAAVYVVVMMLPLAFAAMVWPARRAWATRAIELLVALILSKFVIVAVLALAEGALGQLAGDGVGTVLAGMALLLLAAFSPWVLLRMLPLAEVAAGLGGTLPTELATMGRFAKGAHSADGLVSDWLGATTAAMSRAAAPAEDPPPQTEPARLPPGPPDEAGGPAAETLDHVTADDGSGVPGRQPMEIGNEANAAPSAGSEAPTSNAPGAPSLQLAGSGAPNAASQTPDLSSPPSQTPDERLPGDEPRWQAGDNEWRPLNFPLEDDLAQPWPEPSAGVELPPDQQPEDGGL